PPSAPRRRRSLVLQPRLPNPVRRGARRRMVRRFTTGLVLAAGGSSRLGRPKQLLDYHGRTLLDATLDTARRCGFDQLIVALGGSGHDVRSTVDLSGCDVVDNVQYTTGCSSSIVAALTAIDERSEALVLL